LNAERLSGGQRHQPSAAEELMKQVIRRYGWGVPSAERVLSSAANAVTLIVQSRLIPFQRDSLLGLPETAWLDVKRSMYALDQASGGAELCNDVAAMADAPDGSRRRGALINIDGGHGAHPPRRAGPARPRHWPMAPPRTLLRGGAVGGAHPALDTSAQGKVTGPRGAFAT
jgi:hypothetical protein